MDKELNDYYFSKKNFYLKDKEGKIIYSSKKEYVTAAQFIKSLIEKNVLN